MAKIRIGDLSEEAFRALPLVVEGESKEVRYAGDGLVVIRFKPTVYSFTHNRAAIVPGSDVLRLRASKIFVDVLRSAGIRHAYREVNDRWVLADLVLQPSTPANPDPFRPADINWSDLPIAPPIEVIVKRMHTGTPKHRYHGMSGYPVRQSHPRFAGMSFDAEDAYPERWVRFDWRNPFQDETGKRLADEVLADSMADWFIDVSEARETALDVYDALTSFLQPRNITCHDLCVIMDESGTLVFGEISQDCGRFRRSSGDSLDKDVFRAGGSNERVKEKWALLLQLIGGEV